MLDGVLGRVPTIAVVGGGASGVVTAVNLLARGGQSSPNVVIFERSGRVGAGAAFSTDCQDHLLNVPAGGMSAFADGPGDFARWLNGQAPGLFSPASFVPRRLYRRYLRDALSAYSARSPGKVDIVDAEVVDLEPTRSGARVVCTWGHPLNADAVVLALGLLPPRYPAQLIAAEARERVIANPWEPEALARIPRSATVLLLGTGLTAVDVAFALHGQGHAGRVHAISRHGLLPQVHAPAGPRSGLGAKLAESVESIAARELVRLTRGAVAEAAELGVDWRDVVDALRWRAQEIWPGLDDEQKARFMRHAARFWNIHRHRLAPEVGHELDRLRELGMFTAHGGRVVSVLFKGGQSDLEVHLSKAGRHLRWRADWVVNCTGPDPDVFAGGHPLLDRLRARGLVRPGPLGMGLATGPSGRAVDRAGNPVDWLWAIGALRQGELFESTAIPEIRAQARQLAVHVLEASDSPIYSSSGSREGCAVPCLSASPGAKLEPAWHS